MPLEATNKSMKTTDPINQRTCFMKEGIAYHVLNIFLNQCNDQVATVSVHKNSIWKETSFIDPASFDI
jgi:hypothetical protein